MKSYCGSEFIVSISVFECQLCEVFIRHQKDIEEHIDTIKHLASYKKHLKDCFNEHAYAKQNNVDGQDSLSKDQDSFRNVFADGSHGIESSPDVRNTGELIEDHIGESYADQRVDDPSETCNTLKKGGEERFQGTLIETKDTTFDNNIDNNVDSNNGNNIELDNTHVQTRETYPYDVSGTCFQERQEGACKTIKIMQGEDDDVHDDYDDEAGIIGGFLEDSDDDILNDSEHYGELLRGYTIENNLKVWESYLPTLPLKYFM